MTVAGVMATAAALAGRNAVNATRNRVQLERAFWIGVRMRRARASGDRRSARRGDDATRRRRILAHARSRVLPTRAARCQRCVSHRPRGRGYAARHQRRVRRNDRESAPRDWLRRRRARASSMRSPTGATPTTSLARTAPSAIGTRCASRPAAERTARRHSRARACARFREHRGVRLGVHRESRACLARDSAGDGAAVRARASRARPRSRSSRCATRERRCAT